MLLDIILINKFIQWTIPEEYFSEWVESFYPMIDIENKNLQEIIKLISPYWEKISLCYKTRPSPLFEESYDKLDRKIQIFSRHCYI